MELEKIVAEIIAPPFVRHGSPCCGLLLIALIATGCGHDTVAPPQELAPPSLKILAGANVTDTISTAPTQGLVVQVIDDSGKVAVGVEVRFETPAVSLMSVGSVLLPDFSTVAGAVTDASGRATVRIRMNTKAGAGWVAVFVPLFSLTDTARYTIQPGHGVRVLLAPKDTLLSLGTTFQYRGGVVDRAGNATSDPATFSVTGTSVSITPNGTAMAAGYGTSKIFVRGTVNSTSLSDSTSVLGVPQALIAWTFSSGTVIADLAFFRHAFIPNVGSAPAWEPGGTRMVTSQPPNLMLADSSGGTSVLVTPGFIDGTWPEWSTDGWIYFHATPPGGPRVVRIRPDGTGIQNMTGGRFPSPSPDGKNVAYISSSGGLLAILDVQTRAVRGLTGTDGASTPRWSPDGKWIAYLKGDSNGDLFLVRPDGTELHHIGQHILRAGISWSPDSKWIIGYENGPTLVEVETGTMTYLSFSNFYLYPSWRR